MSKYRLFNMSILKAKAQEGQTEGNLYVAATLENQDCVFEENTSIVMFGVDGLINAIRPYLDTQHGGIAETSNEDAIPERYRFLNGIFVRQKLEHGMSGSPPSTTPVITACLLPARSKSATASPTAPQAYRSPSQMGISVFAQSGASFFCTLIHTTGTSRSRMAGSTL